MKAVFYISGDGLRVVDEKTRGLIVDQVPTVTDADLIKWTHLLKYKLIT